VVALKIFQHAIFGGGKVVLVRGVDRMPYGGSYSFFATEVANRRSFGSKKLRIRPLLSMG